MSRTVVELGDVRVLLLRVYDDVMLVVDLSFILAFALSFWPVRIRYIW